ncbi:MAG TPA: asparaginase, partial [Candidatus Aenigmarchaeota archaeon]|nr:asparaginase [Candidatus Aenigmarchaeota archaeon]
MKAILVRGGAGGRKNFEECEKILEKAAKTGLKYRNAITMVEKAINVLEDSGLFNAGKGAVL